MLCLFKGHHDALLDELKDKVQLGLCLFCLHGYSEGILIGEVGEYYSLSCFMSEGQKLELCF